MNWLAHLTLASDADSGRLVGNLAGDFVRGVQLDTLPPRIRLGVEDHRAIDRATDAHPAVRRVVDRLRPALHRYAGVALDLWFDHVLARSWPRWAPGLPPLGHFTARVGAALEAHVAELPPRLAAMAPRLVPTVAPPDGGRDWLGSYARPAGIERALHGLAGRARRQPNPLAEAADVLRRHDRAIEAAFAELLPDLRRVAAQRGLGPDPSKG